MISDDLNPQSTGSPEDPQLPIIEPADTPEPSQSTRRRLRSYLLIYLIVIITISSLAFFQGRRVNETTRREQVEQFLNEQFELGLEDLGAGRFDLARQRFEAIIRYDPSYPGAEDGVIEAYVALNVPTLTPIPLPTSTPDPSPPEDLFADAQAALVSEEWTTVIDKLLALRAKDPSHLAVEADGMMYIALRNRGMEQIAQGLMEEGLYDLSLAERFGPLDRDAMFRQSLAQQYLLAKSYVGVNWARAAELFGPLCLQGATIDSCFRYAEAAWEYGGQLYNAGDPCGAKEMYKESILAWENGTLVPTATKVAKVCATATAPPPRPTATPTPTFTPTPDGGG